MVTWTQPADWNGGREGTGRAIDGPGTIAFQAHDPKSVVYYRNVDQAAGLTSCRGFAGRCPPVRGPAAELSFLVLPDQRDRGPENPPTLELESHPQAGREVLRRAVPARRRGLAAVADGGRPRSKRAIVRGVG